MSDNGLSSLRKLLEKKYSIVLTQVPVLNRKIDLLCFDDDEFIAIEVKSYISEIPMAIGQCSFYKRGVHKTYIALRKEIAEKLDYEKEILKDSGIGLISFSDNKFKILLEPKKSKPNEQVLEEMLERIKNKKTISNFTDNYKALANTLRLQIYLIISEKDVVGLKELIERFGESYPLTIKHIKILESAGLIESEKKGKETFLKLKSYPLEINENIIKKKILHLLSKRQGLNTTQIANTLRVSNSTATKYLWGLEAQKKIIQKQKGHSKLYYPRIKNGGKLK